MKIKTKTLFRLYGRVHWLDKNDQRNYLCISKEKALYKWATDQIEAERLFKRTIRLALKKRLPDYPQKFFDIFLYDAWVEKIQVPQRKFPVQKQLKLFKEPR